MVSTIVSVVCLLLALATYAAVGGGRAHFRRCRPKAVLSRYPIQRVKIYARDRDASGLIAQAGQAIEAISPALYISSLDFNLHGAGAYQFYTLDAYVMGNVKDLAKLEAMVNDGGLFAGGDASTRAMIAAADSTLEMPRSVQYKVIFEITTLDEPLIVKRIAEAALVHGGVAHRFHSEMINSGRFAGTPDFYTNAIYGFPTKEAAERACKSLERLPFDIVRAVRLYDVGGKTVALKLKRAA